MNRRWLIVGRYCPAALLALVLAGCMSRSGTVSGQVLHENKPLPGGIVTFLPDVQGLSPASAILDEQGHYEVTVPVGEFHIIVDNRELAPRGNKTAPAVLPGIKATIPAKTDT